MMIRAKKSLGGWQQQFMSVLFVAVVAFGTMATATMMQSTTAEARSWSYRKGYAKGNSVGYRHGQQDGYKRAYKASYRNEMERYSDSPGARSSRRGRNSINWAEYNRGYQAGYRRGYENGYRVGSRQGDRDGYDDARYTKGELRAIMRRKMRNCIRYGNC